MKYPRAEDKYPTENTDGLPICPKCKEIIVLDQDEPFAYCACGTMEWGHSGDKYRKRQKELEKK